MKEFSLHPFTLSTSLTGYMPVPRALLEMELPSTAILIYAVLLDRATLSQKNRYSDGNGVVYVIYPIDKLAETFCPVVGTKTTTYTGQKVPTNNKKKRNEKENYYQHEEDESL